MSTYSDSGSFHHALRILHDVCIGCAHCMRVCPTEALRVQNGKAELYPNRCIDCGECFRVCPTHAIIIEQDDFDKIYNYKYRIALVPSVLMGQFPDDVTPELVDAVLIDLGFNDVFRVEESVELLITHINGYVKDKQRVKPVISSFCPAVVRLIQVKFPSLVDNIMQLRPPLDLSAAVCRRIHEEKGIAPGDIGIFYITPCAAKIAAVKSPVGEEHSEVDGVLNMDSIYNRVLRRIKQKGVKPESANHQAELSSRSTTWSLTNGEAAHIKGRCLAIDGIHNVIEFLEKIENEEIEDVDFLELRACDESCAGGVLAAGNRFITVETLRDKAAAMRKIEKARGREYPNRLKGYSEFLHASIALSPILPRSMLKLDEDMARAMLKMERVNRIMCYLPGIDCGVCGAPTCQALAEDIVQGRGSISQCVFLQKTMERTRKLHPDHAFRIMEKIWGKDRFRKDCDKPARRR